MLAVATVPTSSAYGQVIACNAGPHATVGRDTREGEPESGRDQGPARQPQARRITRPAPGRGPAVTGPASALTSSGLSL